MDSWETVHPPPFYWSRLLSAYNKLIPVMSIFYPIVFYSYLFNPLIDANGRSLVKEFWDQSFE